MAFDKDTTIDPGDLTSLVDLINAELTRRNLLMAVQSPSKDAYIDDGFLDDLASKISSINGKHCSCETNPSYKSHKGCPSYSYNVKSAGASEGDIVYSDESTAPDFSDALADVNYLKDRPACDPQCTCVGNSDCKSQSTFKCGTHDTCNHYDCVCQSACNCVTHCRCEDFVPCNCENYTPPCKDTPSCPPVICQPVSLCPPVKCICEGGAGSCGCYPNGA